MFIFKPRFCCCCSRSRSAFLWVLHCSCPDRSHCQGTLATSLENKQLGPVVRSLVSANRWLRGIKMIFAQHLSNNEKNWQKLSYQKILLAW